jgi:hypothetical protein
MTEESLIVKKSKYPVDPETGDFKFETTEQISKNHLTNFFDAISKMIVEPPPTHKYFK